nr:chloroplast enveloppe membrane protein [Interfilum sp. SAG 2147]
MSKAQAFFITLSQWITSFPDRQLEKACIAARQIQDIERACVRYQHAPHLTHDQLQAVKLYLDTIRAQSLKEAERSLFQFETFFWFKAKQKPFVLQQKLWFVETVIWEVKTSTGVIHQQKRRIDNLTADEPIGLTPRSIARTFSRLQTELDPQAEPLLIQEFKLIRYQALATLQLIANLLIVPWLCRNMLRVFFFEPILSYWWNTSQRELFLNSFQEQRALEELQQLEDTAWLDLLMTYSSEVPLSLFVSTIHERALQLVASYNDHSIQALIQVSTDGVCVCTIAILLAFSQRKLSIAQMRAVETLLLYPIDTMKAFLILLFTDLLIGFHSPHGWEIFIESFMSYLGFAPNRYVASLFVSTFPVILDTVFKYWIFRHLNRISPSIVVTYHTMSE